MSGARMMRNAVDSEDFFATAIKPHKVTKSAPKQDHILVLNGLKIANKFVFISSLSVQ